MAGIYDLIVDRIAGYVLQYGWEQSDMNWYNFLFSDDLTEVNIVE